jgi:hypothetical protein
VARPTNDVELRKTLVLRLPIEEGSAKVRAGGAVDDEDDLGLPVWAGHVPLRLTPGAPVANDDFAPGLADAPEPALFTRS